MGLEHWLYTMPLRLRSLFRRHRVEQELDEEFRFHVAQQIEEHIAKGLRPEEARSAALRALNGVEQRKEECRDMRRLNHIDSLLQDLRYGVRVLHRSPTFTAVAVFSLALAIGANTAIFSVVDALMFRVLPVSDPNRCVALALGNDSTWSRWQHGAYESWRDRTGVFADVAAVFDLVRSNLTTDGPAVGVDESPVRISLVSGSYFSVLGVGAALGRTFTAEEDRVPGGHPVAVISDRFWNRRFARARDVLERTVTLNGMTYTILGVASDGFAGDWIGQPTDVWIPLAMQAQVMPEEPGLLTDQPEAGPSWLRVVARLEPGATRQQAEVAATLTFQQFLRQSALYAGQEIPAEQARQGIQLLPAAAGYAPGRGEHAQPLALLMIIVGIGLLIACTNLASLLLARAAVRQREIALRLALGAGRWRITRQLLTESVLLSIPAGALGLLLAIWGIGAPLEMVASGVLPIRLDLELDGRMLAFTGGLCLLTAVLFGLAPAWRASRFPVTEALKDGGTGRRGAVRFGLGKALVIAQVALSLVLLIGAGLSIGTLRNLRAVDLGFDPQPLLLIDTASSQTGLQAPVQPRLEGRAQARLYETAIERLSSLPGVVSVSQLGRGLFEAGYYWVDDSEHLRVAGQAPKGGLGVTTFRVAPRLFGTLGVPLIAGRDFTDRDTNATEVPTVAIINDTLARFYFGDRSPVGTRLAPPGCTGESCGEHPIEIIGVVKGIKQVGPRVNRLGVIYFPSNHDGHLIVRTASDPMRVAASVRQALFGIDRSFQLSKIQTVEHHLDATLAQERLLATLSGFFGLFAVILTCIGLYGVVAYTTARRTNEIGIRLALGSSRLGVLTMVLKESTGMVLLGMAIGLPVTLLATRLVSLRLFGVSPTDPPTIIAAMAALLTVAALAACLPARRASTIHPMAALRHE